MESFRWFDVGSRFVRRILELRRVKLREVEVLKARGHFWLPSFLTTVQFRFKLLFSISDLFTAGHRTGSGLGGNCRNI